MVKQFVFRFVNHHHPLNLLLFSFHLPFLLLLDIIKSYVYAQQQKKNKKAHFSKSLCYTNENMYKDIVVLAPLFS